MEKKNHNLLQFDLFAVIKKINISSHMLGCVTKTNKIKVKKLRTILQNIKYPLQNYETISKQ